MSINSRFTAIYIIGQRKGFYSQRIPVSSCARKETVDLLYLLITPKNGDRNIMRSVRIKTRTPTGKKKQNQFNQFRWESTKVIPIEKT